MKPIIGINLDIEIDGLKEKALIGTNYVNAVLQAGGVPVLIPPMPAADVDSVLDRIDGLMLIGGDDYSPALYGEAQHEKVRLAEKTREDFDMMLVRKAVNERNMPVFGICAGCQALNIALGGSLVQDIPDAFPESKVVHTTSRDTCGTSLGNKHIVKILPGSKLAKLYETVTVDVPTSHHQAVKKIAGQFRPVAHAEDGVVEAIENPDKPFLIGVQWHPERDFEGNKKIFEAFIKAATRVAQPVK